MTMTAASPFTIPPIEDRGRGRPSNAALSERCAFLEERNRVLVEHNRNLRDEILVLRGEVGRLGQYLVALGTTLELGYNADRPDVVQIVRARIDNLGRSCLRKAGIA